MCPILEGESGQSKNGQKMKEMPMRKKWSDFEGISPEGLLAPMRWCSYNTYDKDVLLDGLR